MLIAAACRSAPPPDPTPSPTAEPSHSPPARTPSDDPLERSLPDRIGAFAGGPLVRTPIFERRDYRKGSHHIEVTIARHETSPAAYARWVEQLQGYPLATLDVPEGTGSGFYTCTGTGAAEGCDLHIELRPGVHVELMGGSATRMEIEEFLPGLRLRALAESPAPASFP